MRIIFLNTWHAEAGEAFSDFVRAHEATTDIFCFQEADEAVMAICTTLLPRHQFVACTKPGRDGNFHNVIFYNNTVAPRSTKVLFPDDAEIGIGLYAEFALGKKTLHICNFHGSAIPVDKRDSPSRVRASEEIIAHMAVKEGMKIVGGDFNLLPDTESVRRFASEGYVDLIQKNNIRTTRNHLALDLYTDKQYFADYVFTSPDVHVKSFVVPKEVLASDHLPLILDIQSRPKKGFFSFLKFFRG